MFEVDNELGKFFISGISNHKNDIIDAFASIIGSDYSHIIASTLGMVAPVFVIDKDDIDTMLEYNISEYDRRLLEYYESEFDNPKRLKFGEDENEIFIATYCPFDDEKLMDFLQNPYDRTVSYKNKFRVFYRQKLFSVEEAEYDPENNTMNEMLYDIRYFEEIVEALTYIISNNKIVNTYSLLDVSEEEKDSIEYFYACLYNDLSGMVWNILNSKNITLMDNIEKKNKNKPKQILSDKFYYYFKDVVDLLLFEPKKFMDMVGIENFCEFASLLKNRESDEQIDEVVERMINNRANNISYQIVGMNTPLIEEVYKRILERKKAREEIVKHINQAPYRKVINNRRDIKINNNKLYIENINNFLKMKNSIFYNDLPEINNLGKREV